jgi:hypothetical protein
VDNQLAHLLNLAVGGKWRSISTKDRMKQRIFQFPVEFARHDFQRAAPRPVCRRSSGNPGYRSGCWSGALLSYDKPKIPLRCTSGTGAGALAACGGDAPADCGGGVGKLSHFIE